MGEPTPRHRRSAADRAAEHLRLVEHMAPPRPRHTVGQTLVAALMVVWLASMGALIVFGISSDIPMGIGLAMLVVWVLSATPDQ